MTESFEIIRELLWPLVSFLGNDSVSEIMVNSDSSVYVELAGFGIVRATAPSGQVKIHQQALKNAIVRVARGLGKEFDEEYPVLNARLADGSRIAALHPPVCPGGISLTIRKFNSKYFSLEQLVSCNALPQKQADYLEWAVQEGMNILISGGTGAGKTNLLNALIRAIPMSSRLAIIEDTSEINADSHPNKIRMEAHGEATIRDLVRAAMRHRPDQLIVGEVRGDEALSLIMALNSGHGGSISTIHANGARHALRKLATYASVADSRMTEPVIFSQIGDAIQVVVHAVRDRKTHQRFISEIMRVYGFEDGKFNTETFYGRE